MNSQCIRARYLLTSAMIGVFLCLISAIYAEGDFFQKGERLKEQGNLLDAESAYARALKQINYADRSQLTETDREQEIRLIQRLGDIHLAKNTKRSLIQAACLFNYACLAVEEAGWDGWQSENLEKLKQVECFLRERCQAQNDDIDPKIDELNRKRLATIREKLNEQFMKIDSSSIEEIKKIYQETAAHIKEFTTDLLNQSIAILGPAPCAFSMIGLGSLAREEMTPYSDWEFAFLVEEETEAVKQYFRDLTYLIHFRVISLRETTPWHVSIESLRNFHDHLTPRAFAFDGEGVQNKEEGKGKGCKNPLGNMHVDKTFELIHTPSEMARFQGKYDSDTWWFEKENYLPMELLHFCHIAGDPGLTSAYKKTVNRWLDEIEVEEGVTMRTYLAKKLLFDDDMKKFEPDIGNINEAGKLFHIKNDLYRFPHLSIDRLSLLFRIEDQNTFNRINSLEERGVLTSQGAENLKRVIAEAIYYRLQVYFQYKRQREDMNPLLKHFKFDDAELTQKQFAIDQEGLERIENIYQVIVPLYEAIKAFLSGDEKILRNSILWDDSCFTRGKIALRLLQYEHAKAVFLEQKKLTPYRPDLLNFLGLIFHTQGDLEEAIKHISEALEIDRVVYGDKSPQVAIDYNNLGLVYQDKGDLEEAIKHISEALEIARVVYGDKSPQVATMHNNLELAYKAKGDLEEAIKHIKEKVCRNKRPAVVGGFSSAGFGVADSDGNVLPQRWGCPEVRPWGLKKLGSGAKIE